MITFIVTTYNLEDWLLRRCLSSIVAQEMNRDEYEIIVVDDESDISPQHIIDEYAALANLTLYIQQHNRQGAARNVGLSHAQGKWIQFVDGDDYLFPNTVKSCLDLAESNDLDLLMFGFQEVGDEAPRISPQPKGDRNPSQGGKKDTAMPEHLTLCEGRDGVDILTGDSYMYRNNLFGSCCMQLFRKQLLDDPKHGTSLRFTENIYIEDEEFATRLVWRARRMAKTDTKVYAYYQRPGSTTHSCSREHTDELFRNYFVVLRRLLDFEASVAEEPHDGLTRKIRFLAIDILRRSLREPDWKERWYQSASQLLAMNLYPIPGASYSWKYSLFRLLSQRGIGRHLLRIIEKQ